MFTRRLLNPVNESYWFWAIALFALFVELSFHALLPISISNDSYGYISLSQNIGNPDIAFERSIGYPVFLNIFGLSLLDNLNLVILAQAALAVSTPLLIFKSLVRFGLGYAILGAFIACIYFYNFVISLHILTEPFYVFSIAVYTYFLIKYFYNMTYRNLIFFIASCWLINIIRLSGTQYFLSFLVGLGCYIFINWLRKAPTKTKLGLKHLLLALSIFLSTSFIYGTITNRTASYIWPHFVFNWVYKDGDQSHLGIIKPENGPAAKKLFQEIETAITEAPGNFDALKKGGSEEVKSLTPNPDGKYSKESVALLMHDLIYNNFHDTRSWTIEGILIGKLKFADTMKLMKDAIIEAFLKNPHVLLQRGVITMKMWWLFLKEIQVNNVTLATAYHMQIPRGVDVSLSSALTIGIYKQWVQDLYKHTGIDPSNREFEDPNKFPKTFKEAVVNIKTDNLIGFGHYICRLGMQILRLCWILVAIGVFVFPLVRNKPLLASLLCGSIIPPFITVFTSENDLRHLLMSSPIQIFTAVFVIYLIINLLKPKKQGFTGESHA